MKPLSNTTATISLVLIVVLSALWIFAPKARENWYPPAHNTIWHIKGSFPGPNSYDEKDIFEGTFPFRQRVSWVYTLHTSTNFFADEQTALVQNQDGSWDKYMACELKKAHLYCTDMVETNFMPKELYPNETWVSHLSLGMGDKQNHSGEETITHNVVRMTADSAYIVSNATYEGQKLTLKYEEHFRHGDLTAQYVYNGDKMVASSEAETK